MGIQDIIALSIAAASVVFVGRFVWKTLGGEQSCRKCASDSGEKSQARSPGLKRTPLVSLDAPSAVKAESHPNR